MLYSFDRKKDPERASLYAETVDEIDVQIRQPYVYRDKLKSIFSVRFQYLIDIARVTALKPRTPADKAHYKRLFDEVKKSRGVCNQKTYTGYDYSQHLRKKGRLKLKTFQQIGCDFMYNKKKCVLADDADLGKNLQAILSLCRMSTEGVIKNSIMIVTSITNKNRWENDLLKYINFKINPELKDITVIHGAKSTKLKRFQKESKIYILHHELFAWNFDDIAPLSEAIDALIVDDAVKIKDHTAERTRNITDLMKETPIKLCLTDGAIEENLEDLYPLCNLIDKTIFIGHEQFKKRYCNIVLCRGKKGPFLKNMGYKNIPDAKLKMAGRYLRRTADMVKGQ